MGRGQERRSRREKPSQASREELLESAASGGWRDHPITGCAEKGRSTPRVKKKGQPGEVTKKQRERFSEDRGEGRGVLILGIAPDGWLQDSGVFPSSRRLPGRCQPLELALFILGMV
jgi:hypothetical protein